ncbi:hypothetical protein ABPG72_007294 [Tetrahymena utriculariae]
MSAETETISFEEYEKLQLDFIDSQKQLKEITELFEQYRDETEQMEEAQTRQIELLEQQLEKSNLEKEYLMLNLKKELQEIQLETQKLLIEKDEEVQKLRLEVKMKTLAMTKFMNDYQESLDKENSVSKENDPKNDSDKDQAISKLKKEIAVKDFLINDLGNDIKNNRAVIDEQKTMFQNFSKEILEKTKERDDALKNLKEQEIEELKKALEEKEIYIKQLEKDSDPNPSSEENEIMREMIVEQQEKLMKIAQNFEGYRNESEKLFLAQIQLRDNKIKDLEEKLKHQTKSEQNHQSENTELKQEPTEQKQEGEGKQELQNV